MNAGNRKDASLRRRIPDPTWVDPNVPEQPVGPQGAKRALGALNR